uniref:Uncharacterized protein n=1 Tax=Opuntia streptacantha TaxID=393608 RepID=A0A7C8YW56_OPUST
MPELPIQRLTCTRAVVHRTANGATPEFMPASLRPAASSVRAKSKALTGTTSGEPLGQEPVRRMSLRCRYVASEVAQQRTSDAAGCRVLALGSRCGGGEPVRRGGGGGTGGG